MQGIRRESFLTNPARHVSTTFVRFQWGNGSHCHECLNKPTLPRLSYGPLCLNEFSDKQTRTTHVTKSNSEFPTVTGKKTTFPISLVSVECGTTPFGADELKNRYGDDSGMCARYSTASLETDPVTLEVDLAGRRFPRTLNSPRRATLNRVRELKTQPAEQTLPQRLSKAIEQRLSNNG